MQHASLLEVVHLQQVSLQLHEEVIAAGSTVNPQYLRATPHLMHPPQEPHPAGTTSWYSGLAELAFTRHVCSTRNPQLSRNMQLSRNTQQSRNAQRSVEERNRQVGGWVGVEGGQHLQCRLLCVAAHGFRHLPGLKAHGLQHGPHHVRLHPGQGAVVGSDEQVRSAPPLD